MARVYADVNDHMPRAYWDYDSVNIAWGVLENYEVVRKIGMFDQEASESSNIYMAGCITANLYDRPWKVFRGL